jgi:hypothetical protein
VIFGHLPVSPADLDIRYYIGVGAFLTCIAILLLGRRIARTLELLNWALVAVIIGGFFVLGLIYVPAGTWGSALVGFAGLDARTWSFNYLPAGMDFILLGALVAYSGGGGVLNITLSNWARDKGYGMGSRVGHIGGMVGGERTQLAATGFIFEPDAANMSRWRGWWRIVRVDQWGIFFIGALLGMMLPALLYVTFVAPGTEMKSLEIAAVLASAIGSAAAPAIGLVVAVLAHGSSSRRSSIVLKA